MSDRESRKKELLKELGDVQSLLDDADTPPQRSPSESDILDRMQIRKLASERSNPFLGTPPPSPQGKSGSCCHNIKSLGCSPLAEQRRH